MTAQEIIERIMTQHWDLAACPCWVCKAGRELGYHPMEQYLQQVIVEEQQNETDKDVNQAISANR